MIGPQSLQRFIGREVDVFGTEYDEDGDLRTILTGRLVAIEDGCLALADEDSPGEDVGWIVDLRLVGLVGLLAKVEKKSLQALDGGKVRSIRREEPKPA